MEIDELALRIVLKIVELESGREEFLTDGKLDPLKIFEYYAKVHDIIRDRPSAKSVYEDRGILGTE